MERRKSEKDEERKRKGEKKTRWVLGVEGRGRERRKQKKAGGPSYSHRISSVVLSRHKLLFEPSRDGGGK